MPSLHVMQASNKSRISISKVKMIKLCWHLQHLTTNFNTSGSDRRGLVDAQLGFDSFPDQASSCFPCADHKTKKLTSSVQLCCRIALVHSLFRDEFSAASSDLHIYQAESSVFQLSHVCNSPTTNKIFCLWSAWRVLPFFQLVAWKFYS